MKRKKLSKRTAYKDAQARRENRNSNLLLAASLALFTIGVGSYILFYAVPRIKNAEKARQHNSHSHTQTTKTNALDDQIESPNPKK